MDAGRKSRAIEVLDKLYEFEREPVTENKLQPGRYFAASFAGEHIAGTEFVIGALFVSWGATARDIFLGLLLGNLMAALTPVIVGEYIQADIYLLQIIGADNPSRLFFRPLQCGKQYRHQQGDYGDNH